jgi:hypothetical protein
MEKENEVLQSRRLSEPVEYPERDEESLKPHFDRDTYNQFHRWLYCQYCKFKVKTNLLGTKCKSCDSYMITLL